MNVKKDIMLRMLHQNVKYVMENVKLVKVMHIIVWSVVQIEKIHLHVQKKMIRILILRILIQIQLTLTVRNKKTFKLNQDVKNIQIENSVRLLQQKQPQNVKRN